MADYKNPTAAEVAVADAKKKAASDSSYDSVSIPASNASVKFPPLSDTPANAPTTVYHPATPVKQEVFNLTSADRLVLRDTNNDGIPDIIVVERFDEKAAKVAEDAKKYAPYYQNMTNARKAAAAENAGNSAIEIAAAENVAETKAKKEWKGAVPPVTPVDKAAEAAKKAEADKKAAVADEVAKLTNG